MRKYKLTHSEDFYITKLLKETKIKEIMTPDPIAIPVDAHFSEVPKLMAGRDIRHLPVVNNENHLVGMITEENLYRIQPPHKLEDGTWHYDDEMLEPYVLHEVMETDPAKLHAEDPLAVAVSMMAYDKRGCICIVDDHGALCGILTQMDIIQVCAQLAAGNGNK